MVKIDTSSTELLQYMFFLSNMDTIKCCICNEIPDKLYVICKPVCTKYTYCKSCIYNIEKICHKCPFTRIQFTIDDIGIDYRNNISLDIFKKYNKNKIKSISCNISFDSTLVNI